MPDDSGQVPDDSGLVQAKGAWLSRTVSEKLANKKGRDSQLWKRLDAGVGTTREGVWRIDPGMLDLIYKCV